MIKHYLWGGIVSLGLISQAYAIATEGRSPHERPEWWKEYENAPPMEINPEVVAPKGDAPTVIQESATRTEGTGVPNQLVIRPEGTAGSQGFPRLIDGVQVIESAMRERNTSASSLWRPVMLFLGFFVLGGGAVFGLIRWLSAQVPESPRPTRRRRY